MKYLLLLNRPVGAAPEPDMLQRHLDFAAANGRTGKLLAGSELEDPSTATTLRRSGAETMVTDGPHAETKEHLAGYYVVDCADLDEAIEIARGVPLFDGGSLEIRPLVER